MFYTMLQRIAGLKRSHLGVARLAATWALVGLAAALVLPTDAGAVAAFARQTGLACSRCHTVPPRLTWLGTQFKMEGYTLTSSERATVGLQDGSIFESLPIAGRFRGTLYEKETGRDEVVNPVDSVNVYLGGKLMDHAGIFAQLDFRTDGTAGASWIRGAYARPVNHALLLGVQGGRTSATGSDPFDSLHRMMGVPNDRNILIEGTGAAGSNLLNISSRGRGATVYAFLYETLYLGVGAYDSERRASGPAPKDLFWRAVYRPKTESFYSHVGFFNYRSDDRNISGRGLVGTTRGTRWGIDGSAQVPLPRALLVDVIGLYLRGEDRPQPQGGAPIDVDHHGFQLGTALVYNSRFSIGVGYGWYKYLDTNPFGGAAVADRTNSSLNLNVTYLVRSNAHLSFDVTRRNRGDLDTNVALLSYDIAF
ncbi:MAG: hypothetical protein HY647_02400 [Acidobacteria bacterium]|nr:hypothetical protein [Acidobacteriota bacterium]